MQWETLFGRSGTKFNINIFQVSQNIRTWENKSHWDTCAELTLYQRTGEDKCKGKAHPRIAHKGPEGGGLIYSSNLYLSQALVVVGCSTPNLGRFTPGKQTRYPTYRRQLPPQGRTEGVWKITLPPEFVPSFNKQTAYYSVQLVDKRSVINTAVQ